MPAQFLCGSEFVTTKNIKEIKNPYNDEVVGEVFLSDSSHFYRSSEYLTKQFREFSNLPAYLKKDILYNISVKLHERKDELALLITKETGKPIKFSRIEIERAVLTFRLGAEESQRINGEVMDLSLLKGSEGKTGIVRRFPIGLILGITPWNFPVNLSAHKLSPALASGNVIIIKPSSYSMLCGIEIVKIIHEACMESGMNYCPVNILTLSGSQMDKFVCNDKIKMVSFTGSSEAGWGIKAKAAKQKVALELGGNASVIVSEDADLKIAVSKITIGGFSQAGQSCISAQRIFVNEKIFDDFRDLLTEETKNIKFGNPFDEETICGPMITEDEASRAERWIEEAKNSGAKILYGGKRDKAVLEPTIIENAPDSSKVKCEEVFAPVITLEKYSVFSEAVNKTNNSRFGLQAAVFTNDINRILFAFENIHTGGVIINDASAYRMDSMPYGGVKDSGNTREGVSSSVREMTEKKILVLS